MLTASPIAVDADTAAEMLGRIGRSTFLERVRRGAAPRPRRLGGKDIWLVEELAQVERAAQFNARRKANLAHLSGAETALYRHFDASGRLLYVGISLSPIARLGAHTKLSDRSPLIRNVAIEWFPDRKSALNAELRAISEEGPAYNVAGALP